MSTNIGLLVSAIGTCLILVACSNDPAEGSDTGARDTGARDTGKRDTGSNDTGSGDTGNQDAGGDSGGEKCFDVATTTVDTPFLIPIFLDDSDPKFTPPGDETCPSSTLLSPPIAYEAVVFCNKGPEKEFRFTVWNDDEDAATVNHEDPLLILYAGDKIPSDPAMCLAANDDVGFDDTSAEVLITMKQDDVITLVATTNDESKAPGAMLIDISPPATE